MNEDRNVHDWWSHVGHADRWVFPPEDEAAIWLDATLTFTCPRCGRRVEAETSVEYLPAVNKPGRTRSAHIRLAGDVEKGCDWSGGASLPDAS